MWGYHGDNPQPQEGCRGAGSGDQREERRGGPRGKERLRRPAEVGEGSRAD